jgi:iron(III) transport system ATP-binding protein
LQRPVHFIFYSAEKGFKLSTFALEIRALSKQFEPDQAPAVYNVSLSLEKGEILALVGPSGCGKTTTLRLIAGFEQPDSGSVILGDRTVAGKGHFIPPERRGIGMVFQDHALFPHLTVYENVTFGLSKRSKDQIEKDSQSILKLLGLGRLSKRYPHEISGGERQRVALARALAPQPIVLLLDEPFSSLDADLRIQIRAEVREILKSIGATAIFVTHDQEEALFMGDRLAVFNQGHLEQIATPEEIFHSPNTRFVAEFMGQTDFLTGEVTSEGIQTEIGTLEQHLELPLGTVVEIGIRADDIAMEADPEGESIIVARQFKGAMNIYSLRLPSGKIVHAYQPHIKVIRPGTPVHVLAAPGHPLACFKDGKAVPVTGHIPIQAESTASSFFNIPR